MASSLNTQGSLSDNYTPSFNFNQNQNQNSGLLSGYQLPQQQGSAVSNPVVGGNQPGLLHPPAPIAPVAKHTVTTPDGTTTTQTYDTSNSSSPGSYKGVPITAGSQQDIMNQINTINGQGGTQTTTPTTPTATTTQPNQPLTPFQGAVNNIGAVSGQNAVGQGAANAAGLFGAMGNIAGLQPFAGGTTQGLNQSFANLSRPQSTGNLAGEEGLFNTQNAIFQNAANTSAQQALQQQGIAQQGAETQAGLLQPQPYGITSTPFYPGAGYGQLAGTAGTGGGVAGVGALQQQIGQGGQVQTMKGIQSQAQSLGSNLSNLISQAGINPTNPTVLTSFVNGVNQWLNGQTGDPQYQNFANLINEVSSKYANILNQSGGTPTDVSTTSHNIINALASGQSIQQVLQSLDKNATDSINALSSSAQQNAITSGNQPNYNF